MSLARLSLCLAGSALSAMLSLACLADEAAPTPTVVPVQSTISRPPLVTPSTVSPVPSPSPSVGVSTYTVQDGDTLSSIAAKLYHDASAWQTIFDANRDQLTTPDDLKVGQSLRIPPAPTPGPTSAVTQVVASAIAATSLPATAAAATSVGAAGVPATAAPATAAPATAVSTTDVSAPAAPAPVLPTVAPVTSGPATAAPTAFVPATGPTVVALTAAANPPTALPPTSVPPPA